MSELFLIADTHFCHKNIINYCDRPFDNIDEMNEILVDNWNKTVGKKDEVIVNGDFALCGKDKIIEIGNRLNGTKILILGNHDGASHKTYYEAGFKTILKQPILVREFFVVSHMPPSFMPPLFPLPNGVHGHIYGHVHNDPKFLDATKATFCDSVERINYTPISFEDVVKNMELCKD